MKSLKNIAIESVKTMLSKTEKHLRWLIVNKKHVPSNTIKENFVLRRHLKTRLKEYQEYNWSSK